MNSQTPADLYASFVRVSHSFTPDAISKVLEKPLIIVSTPRSGSTLLFETLARHPALWTIGGESHPIYHVFPSLQAENAAFDSGCLGASHASEPTRSIFRAGVVSMLRDAQGRPAIGPHGLPAQVKFLEKTPRNALNIPFLKRVFPDAQYIYLHRDARQNINSIMTAWEYPNFITFRDLPGWSRKHWHLLLPPGWRELEGKSIAEIAAFQWRASNEIMLDELEKMPAGQWLAVSYTALVNDPGQILSRICAFAGIPQPLNPEVIRPDSLPLSSTTVSRPDPEKWRGREHEINTVIASVQDTIDRIARLPQ